MSFGKNLKELRKAKSMTQKELGELLNLSERIIGFYESDERFPRGGETLKEIADIFNVSIDSLLGRNEYHLNVYGLEKKEIEALKIIIETMKKRGGLTGF